MGRWHVHFHDRTLSWDQAVLVHHLRHNKVLSEQVIVLNVETQDVPHIPYEERIEDEALSEGFVA